MEFEQDNQENEQVEKEIKTIWDIAMEQLKPKIENDQKLIELEIALESKKKSLLDNAAINEIDRKIDAAKETKNKAKIRISKLEKRKTNISKKTDIEILKLEKQKNEYINTKMKEFQL